jgi:catechol 2,3-dioxygenase-like lactoylglutathione lyase family enzyme
MMNLRLHEIELGVKDVQKSKAFYSEVLGLDLVVGQAALNVFRSRSENLDFNTSSHFPGRGLH